MAAHLRVIAGGLEPRVAVAEAPAIAPQSFPDRIPSPPARLAGLRMAAAVALSLALHGGLVAWSYGRSADEARAEGGSDEWLTSEGVSVVLIDSMPSEASDGSENLPEALPIEAAEVAVAIAGDVPVPAPEDVLAPVAEAVSVTAAEDAAVAIADAPIVTTGEHLSPAVPGDVSVTVTGDAGMAVAEDASVAMAEDVDVAVAGDAPVAMAGDILAPAVGETVAAVASDGASQTRDEIAAVAEDAAATETDAAVVAMIDDSAVAVEETIPTPPMPRPRPETAPPPPAPPARADPPRRTAEPAPRSERREASVADEAARAPRPGNAGAAGASNTERGGADVSSYQAKLAARLRRFRTYPAEAEREGITGTAVVTFTVNAGGAVTGASLARSSGARILDDAALAMVRRAAPFPPIPAGLGATVTVSVPVRYDRR